MSHVVMRRRKPLGSSRRTRLRAPERAHLVAKILQARPRCERCRDEPSVHVHELKFRSRGGSIFDPSNLVAIGQACHDWIHSHPLEAGTEGFAISRYPPDRTT